MFSDDIQKAIDFYKSNAAKSALTLAPDVQKDLQIASGLQQYNLYPTALTLAPVLTPLRNTTPRTQGLGAKAEYKAIVGVSGITTANVWGSEGSSGQKINLATADITVNYRSLKVAGALSFEQQWAGQGYIDSKATEVVNVLRQLMVMEEQALLFGCNSTAAAATQFGPGAVGTPASPTLAAVAAGGTGAPSANSSLGAVTVFVKITAVTGMGESLPSAEVSQAVAANQYVKVTLPTLQTVSGQPVLYYNVYASTTTGTEKLCTSAQLTYDVTVAGSAASPVTTNVSTGSAVFIGGVPGAGATPPVSDGTASTLAYNGLLPQIFASSQAGITGFGIAGSQLAGAAQPNFGATVQAANGQLNYLGGASNTMQTILKAMWDSYRANPDYALVSSQEAIKFATFLANTPYYVTPDGGQDGFAVGYRAAKLANPITGKFIALRVHPNLPQGTLLLGSESLPEWYVPSSVPAPFTASMLQDYTEIDYPPVYNTAGSGDSWVIQVLCMGAPRLFTPVLFGVLCGIVAG